MGKRLKARGTGRLCQKRETSLSTSYISCSVSQKSRALHYRLSTSVMSRWHVTQPRGTWGRGQRLRQMCHVCAHRGGEGDVLGMGLICLLGQVLGAAGADTINLMLHATLPPSASNFTGNMYLTHSYGKSLSAIRFYNAGPISCNTIPSSPLLLFE